MANEQNLQRGLSAEEARARGKKGGIASGRARRRRKALRERLEALLSMEREGVTADEAICIALIEKALTGDVRAVEVIRDTIGEKPVKENAAEPQQKLVICWDNGNQCQPPL